MDRSGSNTQRFLRQHKPYIKPWKHSDIAMVVQHQVRAWNYNYIDCIHLVYFETIFTCDWFPGVLVVKFNFSSRHGLVKILEPILMIPELIPGNWFWRSAVFSDSYASFNHFLETCTPSRPPGLSLEYFDTIFCIVYQQTFTGEHSLNVLNSALPIYSIYRTSNERSNSYSDDFLKKFQNQIRFEIQKLY